jgi:hypothetical protein
VYTYARRRKLGSEDASAPKPSLPLIGILENSVPRSRFLEIGQKTSGPGPSVIRPALFLNASPPLTLSFCAVKRSTTLQLEMLEAPNAGLRILEAESTLSNISVSVPKQSILSSCLRNFGLSVGYISRADSVGRETSDASHYKPEYPKDDCRIRPWTLECHSGVEAFAER